MINCSARLICKALKSVHINRLLYNLHWLPISSRIRSHIRSPLVQFLHTFLSCFISALLLALFAEPRIMTRTFLTDPGGEILSIRRTYDLELSSCQCQAFVFNDFF